MPVAGLSMVSVSRYKPASKTIVGLSESFRVASISINGAVDVSGMGAADPDTLKYVTALLGEIHSGETIKKKTIGVQ